MFSGNPLNKPDSRFIRSPHDSDFEVDNNTGLLVYWDTLNSGYRELHPGRRIEDRSLCVGRIGNENITFSHTALRPRELHYTEVYDSEGRRLGEPVPCGISGFVFWGSKQTKQSCIADVSDLHLGKNPTEKNRLYFTQVGDLNDVGWQVYYVPKINPRIHQITDPLHSLIVPTSVIESGILANATDQERFGYMQAFVKWLDI